MLGDSVLLPLSVSPYESRPSLECEHGFNARGNKPSQMMPDRNAENRLTLWSRLVWGTAKARWDPGHCFPPLLPSTWRGAFEEPLREKLPRPRLSLYERASGMASQDAHTGMSQGNAPHNATSLRLRLKSYFRGRTVHFLSL